MITKNSLCVTNVDMWLRDAITLIMVLPGKIAKEIRSQFMDIIEDYIKTNTNHAMVLPLFVNKKTRFMAWTPWKVSSFHSDLNPCHALSQSKYSPLPTSSRVVTHLCV